MRVAAVSRTAASSSGSRRLGLPIPTPVGGGAPAPGLVLVKVPVETPGPHHVRRGTATSREPRCRSRSRSTSPGAAAWSASATMTRRCACTGPNRPADRGDEARVRRRGAAARAGDDDRGPLRLPGPRRRQRGPAAAAGMKRGPPLAGRASWLLPMRYASLGRRGNPGLVPEQVAPLDNIVGIETCFGHTAPAGGEADV